MSYWSVSFPGTTEYLREVRRFTAGALQKAFGSEDVVQVASELAANAILHTTSGQPGGTFTVHLAARPRLWQIRVDDQGAFTTPQIRPATANHLAAGGLAIVAALSSAWGVIGDEYGRAVWAEISFPAPEVLRT